MLSISCILLLSITTIIYASGPTTKATTVVTTTKPTTTTKPSSTTTTTKSTTTASTSTSTTTTTQTPTTTTTIYVSPCEAVNYNCSTGFCPKGPPTSQIESPCSCKQCTCPSVTLAGQFCEKFSPLYDPCLITSTPCPTDHYSCDSSTMVKRCTCAAGYTGVNCEFEIGNLCASYPCLNGGICSGDTTEYNCTCPDPYRGKQCQTTGDVCASVNCLNGGTCTSVLNDTQGVCKCTAKWQGASCEQSNLIRDCGTSCTGSCYKPSSSINNTALFGAFTNDPMSVSKCKNIMMNNAKAEFFIVAGSICYIGIDPMLTIASTDAACNTDSGSSSKCGNNENVILYEYPYVNETTQCTATSCGSALTGYCIEQNGTSSCVCRPGTTGTTCQNTQNPCIGFGCQNGGTCLATEDNSAARCICKTGYSGTKCTDVDRCYFAPCKNGGSCANSNAPLGYTCSCLNSYWGDNCENYRACSSSPCANGATCSSLGATYYDCDCAPGWEGRDCDEDVDECAVAAANTPKPIELCQNGGTCINTMGSYECACINGTEGFDCGFNPNDCNMTYTYEGVEYPNLCIAVDPSAECIDGFASYTCKCSIGYKGELCMEDVDECADASSANPPEVLCENFGSCVNTLGSYHCDCIYGTYGFNCSINPDDCAISNVTFNGTVYPNECIARDKRANCTDGFGTYYCECSQYWTGEHCMTDVDECAFVPQPCQNFGTCHNTDGWFECACINGTEGHECQINPDDCINVTACNTADKKANCTDGFATYTCSCSPDYTMQYCDLEMIIYNVLQLIGGGSANEADLIAMLRDLLRNPSMMKDLIPFVIGLQPLANRTRMSWDVEDLFLWIAYEEKTLDLKKDLFAWNDVVLGNCFTFNHFNNTQRSYLMRSDGAQGGLKAALKLNTDEYVPWTETTAIMTFIHPNTEMIFSESPRYNSEPSALTTIQSKESRYVRLGGRYGKCVRKATEVASYYYDGSYTTDGCLRSCYQDQVEKECNCMDSRYPMSEKAVACELPDRKCVDKIVAKGDVSTWAGCECPLPCTNSQFDSSYTVAPFVRNSNKCNTYTAAQRVNNTICDDLDGQVDYVIVNVQVPKIVINIFEETPAWTFNRVIGNIGGLGGVVCGLNLITFFEFGFFFFFQLPMTLLFNKIF